MLRTNSSSVYLVSIVVFSAFIYTSNEREAICFSCFAFIVSFVALMVKDVVTTNKKRSTFYYLTMAFLCWGSTTALFDYIIASIVNAGSLRNIAVLAVSAIFGLAVSIIFIVWLYKHFSKKTTDKNEY